LGKATKFYGSVLGLPVALLAGMLSALQMVAGIIEKAEAAPNAPAVNFRKMRL